MHPSAFKVVCVSKLMKNETFFLPDGISGCSSSQLLFRKLYSWPLFTFKNVVASIYRRIPKYVSSIDSMFQKLTGTPKPMKSKIKKFKDKQIVYTLHNMSL